MFIIIICNPIHMLDMCYNEAVSYINAKFHPYHEPCITCQCTENRTIHCQNRTCPKPSCTRYLRVAGTCCKVTCLGKLLIRKWFIKELYFIRMIIYRKKLYISALSIADIYICVKKVNILILKSANANT